MKAGVGLNKLLPSQMGNRAPETSHRTPQSQSQDPCGAQRPNRESECLPPCPLGEAAAACTHGQPLQSVSLFRGLPHIPFFLSPLCSHTLSRSGSSFQKVHRGLPLAQGPGKPRELTPLFSTTLHLPIIISPM